ncbi:hypothetical protein GF323_03660 [Candidatus Woesearchaeota archaeon]|nr:hypothetical protein [Candidatus Woesearchaeota archaeon]
MVFESRQAWEACINSLRNIKKPAGKEEIRESLVNSIKRNIPKGKLGILFSGGIDSTFIALVCKQLEKDFTCYCVGIENSEDLAEAQKVAEKLNLKLKTRLFSLAEAGEIIKQAAKIIGKPDVLKVGVASVEYAAIGLAKKDNIKYFFSGLGSEEIFAGYQRHLQARDINEECWRGLLNMYERDIERDLMIAGHFGIKLLLPFLDKEVIANAMSLPSDQKIRNNQNKYILRHIAQDMGLNEEFAQRKKRAAQYGSKFDRAILRLARKHKLKYKKDYLKSLLRCMV